MKNKDKKILQQMRSKIRYLAQKYKNSIASEEDLFQAGINATLEVLDKIDRDQIRSLENFLFIHVYRAIKAESINNAYAVHIPSGTVVSKGIYNAKRYKGIDIDNMPEALRHDYDYDLVLDLLDIFEKHDPEGIAYKYIIEKYSYREISEITNKNISYIGNLVNKVKRIIAHYMED